jgi:hypothetical protein
MIETLSKDDIKSWVLQNASDNTELDASELDHVATCLEHIYRWYHKGYPVGGFLTAVIRGNFSEICFRADSTNRKVLYLYALFLTNKLPSDYKEKIGLRVGTKPTTLLTLCQDILDLAEHGDYSCGNAANGLDEGQVSARRMLDNYRAILKEYW